MPKKATTIIDVKTPDRVKPSATSRPIVVSDRPMMANDPMVVAAAGDSADQKTPGEPQTAPEVSRTAKTLQPTHDLNQPAEAAAPEVVAPEAAADPPKQSDAPQPEADDAAAAPAPAAEEAPAPDDSTDPTDATADEKPAAEAATVPETAAPEAPAPAADVPATPDSQAKASAKNDAEAAKADAAAQARLAQTQKLIDSRQFFVPINAVEQKRTLHASVWLTLLVIVLAALLIDFMLDANVIVLLTKLPHTHFFAPQPHF